MFNTEKVKTLPMKIAIVGATGLVGRQMTALLEKTNIKDIDLLPVASAGSSGKIIPFRGQKKVVMTVEEAIDRSPEVALFSAGGTVSREYAPLFAQNGTYVIDNSSAWRRDETVPLVVPEINGDVIKKKDFIIANPNCSTIQLVMALAPLKDVFGIRRVTVSTYQSVSGSGMKAIEQMEGERNNTPVEKVYPWPIDRNVIPQGGAFLENGFTEEEQKLVFETCKILRDKDIQVAATVVRVPVTGGHSISASVECNMPCPAEKVTNLLSAMPGVTVIDNPATNTYPMPLYAEGKDEVFVGRIRNDLFKAEIVHLWVVADNLRKGAATNAVQILEHLIKENIIA